MRNVIVETSGLKRLLDAAHSLLFREAGTPGVGLVSGPVGLGKTTSAKHICLIDDAIWLEALPPWTSGWMLGDLAEELGCERSRYTQKNFRNSIGALRQHPRAVFIDEADRLVRKRDLVETLRAIHDQTQAPLILIGMDHFPRAVRTIPQLDSRVAHWVEFQPCDLRDVRLLAEQLCEVELDAALLKHLHQETGGSARAIRVALERVERWGKRHHARRVAMADLPDRFELIYSPRRPSSFAERSGAHEAPAADRLSVVKDAQA